MAACVYLKRGSSARATWVLEDVPGGTTVTVGADPSNDWQVQAASVPPTALSMLLLSGNLFVRSARGADVLLNGSALADVWTPVYGSARIDVGLARLEVTRGAERSAFDALGALPFMEGERAVSAATRAEFTARAPRQREYAPGRAELSAPPLEGPPSPRVDAEELDRERPSFAAMRPSFGFAPSLLGDEPRTPSRRWPYVVLGIGTAFAYLSWLYALEQFF